MQTAGIAVIARHAIGDDHPGVVVEVRVGHTERLEYVSCCILASLTPVFGSKPVRQSKFSSIKKKIVHRPLCANDTAVSLDRDYTSEIGQYIATSGTCHTHPFFLAPPA